MKHYIILVCIFFLCSELYSQQLAAEEEKLYTLIMDYRKGKGLPFIPLSSSLTKVAQAHVKDLHLNKPDKNDCNMHSWSSKGAWSSCCYTDDHAEAECMWDKPREMTDYEGNGYEIAYGSYGMDASASGAIAGWVGSPGHLAVMINQGIWKSPWNAIGIGIYEGFAVVWFGKEEDNT